MIMFGLNNFITPWYCISTLKQIWKYQFSDVQALYIALSIYFSLGEGRQQINKLWKGDLFVLHMTFFTTASKSLKIKKFSKSETIAT